MSMYRGGAQIDEQKSAGHHRSNDTFSSPVTYTHYREPIETESYRKGRPSTASRRKLTPEAGEDPETQRQAMDEDDIVTTPVQPRRKEGQIRPKSRLGRQRPKPSQSRDNFHMSHSNSQSAEPLEIEGICRSSFDEHCDDILEDMQRPTTSRGKRQSFDLGSPEVMTPVTPNRDHRRPRTGHRRDSISNLVYRRPPSALSSPSLTPSPPPAPVQYARPKSGMGHQRRRPSSHDAVAIARSASVLSEFTPPPRPMSRYAVLPSIGTKVDLEATSYSPTPQQTARSPIMTPPSTGSVLHRVDSLKLTRESSSETGTEDSGEFHLDTEFRQLTRQVDVPPEPSVDDDDSVILAVKLPHNGKRLKRRFRRSNTLASLLHFAESRADLDFDGFQLVCNVQKKTFIDLGETIASAGLPDRTLLHIQPPEMI